MWRYLFGDLRRIPQVIDLALFFVRLHVRRCLLEPVTVQTTRQIANGTTRRAMRNSVRNSVHSGVRRPIG